ncbi:MAG: hypothetical protein JNK05_09915 [Myxococcales bacterium]|nr:hypothetical protein [Myxococcales bacterium]
MTYRDPTAARPPLTPLYLRSSIATIDAMAGPFIVPYLEPAKVQGALKYAPQAAGEQPLAVVDDSITGSAKSGMLVTDRAVYFSEGRLRVPLEVIVEPPSFPRGVGEKGQLRTAMGTVPFDSTLDEVRRAMCNTLRAIAFFNRGGYRLRYGNAPFAGPVGEIATRVLSHPKLPVVPSVPLRAVHAASNVAAGWLDYDDGEELLAFLDETGGENGDRFVALTDRRVLARIDDHPVTVPYHSLLGATFKSGMLTHTLALQSSFGAQKLETIAPAAAAKIVVDFLQELTRLPPEHRRSLPAIAPGAEDPSGAAAAMQLISWPDLRAATLLELVHQSVAVGAMPAESGKDMVARVLRMQRTLRGGHGSTQGWSRTPLSAGDFELLLSTVFGPPVRQSMVDARTGLLEYDLRRAGSAAGTIASNVIGITLLAVVGVGWISSGSGSSQTVRVRIMEAPGGAGFLLADAQDNPLAKDSAKIAGGLLESLAVLSAGVLARRVLLGWNVSPQALVSEPVASLDARARALVSHIDLAPFLDA